MPLIPQHSALAGWVREHLATPTPVQCMAWPRIAGGASVVISAPTGSGKTLAAWVPLLDRLLREPGAGTRVIYITPLRALSRDVCTALERPLTALDANSVPRVGLRTGDTSPAERARQRRNPPEVLVTTPESLFVLLGSPGGRRMLRGTEAVVVDELHALAGSKRGAHLTLSLERLEALAGRTLQRIGISATARPRKAMCAFLAGTGRDCDWLDAGAPVPPQVTVELPERPLGAYPDQVHWQQVHDRIAALAADRDAVLVFCRTRAQVERTAAALADLLGEQRVAAHHGSLDASRRQQVESDFKHGRLGLVVSSASLELGLDLGRVDLVCQLGAPGSINLFRQRAGRACHRPGERPRARLFPLTLGDLLEARALVAALDDGVIEDTPGCTSAADVLCQHLIAMVAGGMRDPDEILRLCRGAQPWSGLQRSAFDTLLELIGDGFVSGRDGHRALLSRSRAGRMLEASEPAGRLACMNAGTIPEWFQYRAVLHPEGRNLGRLDEEFAFESAPGQILQLGNRPFRVLRVRPGVVELEPAPGETANVPFWFGDGAGRTRALAERVLGLMQRFEDNASGAGDPVLDAHLSACRSVLGRLPGPDCIVIERFADPGEDRHVVIHSPLGARLNRAWGLALRKRFCRQFNFELQAAATDDGVLISLGATHSFELPEIPGYLSAAGVGDVLVQALLDTPIFQDRFRWAATNALAILRRTERGPVPAQIQRSQTENLIARVFPDQLACLENLSGPRHVPDHALVQQALTDCLNDHLDVVGLQRLLTAIECGQVQVHCVDLAEPSPLAAALIYAPRYSFLDPAGAEERRTRAFEQPVSARAARPQQATGGWIRAATTREFEQTLTRAGYLLQSEGETGVSAAGNRAPGGWTRAFAALVKQRAAVNFRPGGGRSFWAALDRLSELRAIWPDGEIRPWMPAALLPESMADADEALCRLLLDRIRAIGQMDPEGAARETGLPLPQLQAAFARLRAEGVLFAAADGMFRTQPVTGNREAIG